jgi:hypothetical protein
MTKWLCCATFDRRAGPYPLSAVQPSCRYLQTGTDRSEKQASPLFRARRQRPFAFIEDENRQVTFADPVTLPLAGNLPSTMWQTGV